MCNTNCCVSLWAVDAPLVSPCPASSPGPQQREALAQYQYDLGSWPEIGQFDLTENKIRQSSKAHLMV